PGSPANAPGSPVDAPAVAARIDSFTGKHWQENKVRPAGPAGDAEFLRRATLDLAGRIPTLAEAKAFAEDRSPDKRARAVRRLMESEEYPLHLGRVLDDLLMGKYAGDPEFLEYLREAVAQHKPWDRLFREVMLGPWDTRERKRASRFLAKRQNSLDDLTTDTTRAFFGVNVSCAKCHDHPLVPDWKQDHYYGMASFFNRTYEAGKGKRNGEVGEKPAGDVTFMTTKGERRTAKVMYLSGKVLDGAAVKSPTVSRRELLVKAALEEPTFFRRAVVNQLWSYFLGRGLVQPTDQMHSANPPAVAGLLEWLGDDFAAHGYDLDRLVAGIVSSKTYSLASRRAAPGGDSPAERHFAQAKLRPLTPQQFAFSLALATGDGKFEPRQHRELEGRSAGLLKSQLIDPRSDRFQSSAGEALFLSNNAEVQKLMAPAGSNLVARLAALPDAGQVVDTAVWTVLSRAPEADERAYLVQWLESRKEGRAKACGQLVWALVTSAEFRFNH
ncbi:MAG TPA: DUF1549 domain-containing protein, partial [Gemmataceae bacterium]|nr:DUF1549 domain-containing protein [Gemmataceae bacterium]